jgi:hypothetical protein
MTDSLWNKKQITGGSSVEAEIRWPSSEVNSCPARLIEPMVSKARGKKEVGFGNFDIFLLLLFHSQGLEN